jgi:hypothetical protein
MAGLSSATSSAPVSPSARAASVGASSAHSIPPSIPASRAALRQRLTFCVASEQTGAAAIPAMRVPLAEQEGA